ncbi:MAG: phage tail tube protein [Bauldia sp.]
MPDAIRAKTKLLLVKPEGTYGVSSAPTGDDAVLGTNFELMPMEGEDVSRDLEYPWLGQQEQYVTAQRGVLSFSTEVAPSGSTGVAPKWGALMRACAVSQTITEDVPEVEDPPADAVPGNVLYKPMTAAHESVSVHFHWGPTRHIFLGARGTGVTEFNAQGIPRTRWTLTGIWVTPTAEAQVTPDYSDWTAPEIVSNAKTPTFTVNGVSLVMRSLSFDMGNQVEPRFLVGKHEITIPDRAPQISVVVEATPLGTFDPFAIANARTKVPVVLVHGTVAGARTRLEALTCQLSRPAAAQVNQGIVEWPLVFRPLPDEGDDEWSLKLI